jgi:hypothetical protein
MLACLNLVAKDLQNSQLQWHWRFLEKTATASTVASQMDYDLPTDIDTTKIFGVSERTNDITFKYIPYDRFLRLVADPSANVGQSVWWTFWANVLKLYPVPSAVLTMYLNYVSLITAWTDAATSNEVPAKYDLVVIDGAMMFAYKFDPELGDWRTQQAAYEAGKARMIADNNMMIGEIAETESHRNKVRQGRRYGTYFPLDSAFG